MKTKRALLTVAAMLLAFSLALSCSDDKQICTECKAACTGGPSVSDMNYCGDENAVSSQESSFRASHPDCEVTCTRK